MALMSSIPLRNISWLASPRDSSARTHTGPRLWMEIVARDLAEHLKRKVPLGPELSRSFYIREKQVSRVGDLVDMLKLPPDQRLFPPQSITIHRVIDSRTGRRGSPKSLPTCSCSAIASATSIAPQKWVGVTPADSPRSLRGFLRATWT